MSGEQSRRRRRSSPLRGTGRRRGPASPVRTQSRRPPAWQTTTGWSPLRRWRLTPPRWRRERRSWLGRVGYGVHPADHGGRPARSMASAAPSLPLHVRPATTTTWPQKSPPSPIYLLPARSPFPPRPLSPRFSNSLLGWFLGLCAAGADRDVATSGGAVTARRREDRFLDGSCWASTSSILQRRRTWWPRALSCAADPSSVAALMEGGRRWHWRPRPACPRGRRVTRVCFFFLPLFFSCVPVMLAVEWTSQDIFHNIYLRSGYNGSFGSAGKMNRAAEGTWSCMCFSPHFGGLGVEFLRL